MDQIPVTQKIGHSPILTFAPMMLLQGNVGDFIRTIAIALSIMLFWSFVMAIVLTGPMAARLLPNVPQPPVDQTEGLLYRALRFFVRKPLLSLVLAALMPAAGFVALFSMPVQFFPLADRNQFYLSVSLPSHADIGRTRALVEQVDAQLRGIEGITQSYWVIGGTAPAFYYNILSGRTSSPGYAQGMITTATAEDARRILTTLQQDLSDRFAEADINVRKLSQGPPVGAPVTFLIHGAEIDELRRIGGEVQQAIATLPEASYVSGGLAEGAAQLRFIVDRDAAQMIGLGEDAIASQLRAGLSGVIADQIIEGQQRLPIRVQFADHFRRSIEAISDMPLLVGPDRAANGQAQTVPLSALASPRLEVAETLIYRYNGERMNFIRVYPQPDVLPSALFAKAVEAIEAADIILPPGYRIDTGGEDEERSNTVDGLLASVAMLAALGFAVLVATFRSFRLTIGTVIVAGLSTGLSLLAVAALGYPLGINALIGVIGSVGVSVNASIIIFTTLQHNACAASGDPDAVTREIMRGSRHIISTSLTTFGGFLPLLFQGGLFWPPFAAAVAGGVLLSTSLAYLFAPAYFRIFHARGQVAETHDQATTPAPAHALVLSPITPPQKPPTQDRSTSRNARPVRRYRVRMAGLPENNSRIRA